MDLIELPNGNYCASVNYQRDDHTPWRGGCQLYSAQGSHLRDFGFDRVQEFPISVRSNGACIYVLDFHQSHTPSQLLRFDIDGTCLATLVIGKEPSGMACTADRLFLSIVSPSGSTGIDVMDANMTLLYTIRHVNLHHGFYSGPPSICQGRLYVLGSPWHPGDCYCLNVFEVASGMHVKTVRGSPGGQIFPSASINKIIVSHNRLCYIETHLCEAAIVVRANDVRLQILQRMWLSNKVAVALSTRVWSSTRSCPWRLMCCTSKQKNVCIKLEETAELFELGH